MTPDELEALLDGQALLNTVDIKTLVLDEWRKQPTEVLVPAFKAILSQLSQDDVRRYFFMQRS